MDDYRKSEVDLFPHFALPFAQDDETLFSWCARYHRLSDGPSPRATSRRLFGHPTAGLRHDLPFYLQRFHENSNGFLGSIIDVAKRRTLYGFYAPFLSEEISERVIQALYCGRSAEARGALGLSKGGGTIACPLKACPDCIEEHREKLPVAWWAIDHQWPSVMVCRRHSQPLLMACDEIHGRTRTGWPLPMDIKPTEWKALPTFDSEMVGRLCRLAEWTDVLVNGPERNFDEAILRSTYLLKAKALGWIALDGSLRLKTLRDAFQGNNRRLEQLPGWGFLHEVSGVNAGFLGSLLHQHPGRRHPLKHILLMSFLFTEPNEFLDAYSTTQEIVELGGQVAVGKMLTDLRRQLVTLVGEQHMLVSHAAQQIGVTIGQAVKHLNKEGVARKGRPRIVGTPKEARLRKMLNAGDDRACISLALGIRRGLIKDYLAGDEALRSAWKSSQYIRQRNKHRELFLRILKENPGLPIKAIRRLPNNGFQWLYNNDIEWLTETLPAIWKR